MTEFAAWLGLCSAAGAGAVLIGGDRLGASVRRRSAQLIAGVAVVALIVVLADRDVSLAGLIEYLATPSLEPAAVLGRLLVGGAVYAAFVVGLYGARRR